MDLNETNAVTVDAPLYTETPEVQNKTVILKTYIRNKKNEPIGVLLATPVMVGTLPVINFGWSKVKIKAGDKFDRVRGEEIALGRCKKITRLYEEHMAKNWEIAVHMPPVFKKYFERMQARSLKYFKGLNIINTTFVFDNFTVPIEKREFDVAQ